MNKLKNLTLYVKHNTMGVSMSVAKNAQTLNAMGFTELDRFAQVTDSNFPTGGRIKDLSGNLHDFVLFRFAQKKTSTPPDYLEIKCSSMYSMVTGKVNSQQTKQKNNKAQKTISIIYKSGK